MEKSRNIVIIVSVLFVVFLVTGGILFFSFLYGGNDNSEPEKTHAGELLYTHVFSEGIGNIAIRVELPIEPRYNDGAPIVVMASTWFVDKYNSEYSTFHLEHDPTIIGAISVTNLWPGKTDPETKIQSEGSYDYGGPDCIRSLRDTILFAGGNKPNIDGYYITELLDIVPLTDNLGLYASSHAGVVATNVMAYYGDELQSVKYFVGRENPTSDEMYALEIGHFDDQRKPVINPYYDPQGYTSTRISVNYSNVGWIQNDDHPDGIPCFYLDQGNAYILSGHGPHIKGKQYFSRSLTSALYNNGVLTMGSWPVGLATPNETNSFWPYRVAVKNYDLIREKLPDLKVILVFARNDHVQSAPDKPHIHQAYDGFSKTAGLWVRMNADNVYFRDLNDTLDNDYPEKPANNEPDNWNDVRSWGYPADYGSHLYSKTGSYAGMAEMADRTRDNEWKNDLEEVLHSYKLDDLNSE